MFGERSVRDAHAYPPGGLDAERHRRGTADVLIARPDELLVVADARHPDFDQDLLVREGARIWEVDWPDSTAELADSAARIKEAPFQRWMEAGYAP
jgi:hypothetical protein